MSRSSQPKDPLSPIRQRLVWAGWVLILIGVAGAVRGYLLSRGDPTRFDTSTPEWERLNAPFITTPESVVEEMVRLADLSTDDLVYDLGCGDGRLVVAAVKASSCRGIGVDIDPARVAEAQQNARRQGVEERVEIRLQDVFTVDLSEADVVVMYLLPWMTKKLIPQFDQMRPGTRIVSHDFGIATCKPDQTVEVDVEDGGKATHYVHLWILPLRKGTAPE